VANNRLLGKFTLGGIPPAKKGVPKLKVVFSLDENCILNVEVRDEMTNQKQNLLILNDKGRLSHREI
jgi:molecular chaperone DnaK (HSP70)